jgi:SSS family solute:Na+ symporter
MDESTLFGTKLNQWDFLVVLFYFGFQFSLGMIFRVFSKDASDYFRAGGSMLWWLVGASCFMCQFSAWTFTGAAGKAYMDGMIVTAVFMGNAIGYLGNAFITAHRFRRMRVITAMDGVRDRFGPVNEQVFTWVQVPVSVIYAGIWLNGLAIIVSGLFNVPPLWTIGVVGAVVVFMTVSGGSWAVVASDFMQTVLLMAITLVTCYLTLSHPAIGGVTGLIDKLPESHFKFWEADDSTFVYVWIFAIFVVQSFKLNNMFDAYRYLCVKEDSHARKASIMAAILMFIGPIIWFIPAMAAYVIQPDGLVSVFPDLKNPHEGAFIFMGLQTMPLGMLGLLVCALFAATISSMDTGLNRNAGILVKNFYHPIIHKAASPVQLLVAGKIATAILGAIVITAAILINSIENFNLFDIMVLFGSFVGLPFATSLVWGLFVKGAPRWAGWSSLVVGASYSLFTKYLLDPAWFGFTELTQRENADFLLIASGIGNIAVCTAWFFFTVWVAKKQNYQVPAEVEDFFERQKRPVDHVGEGGQETDDVQARTLGILCFIYGGFVTLLGVIIPNPIDGRACFWFCGLLILSVGGILYRASKAHRKRQDSAAASRGEP